MRDGLLYDALLNYEQYWGEEEEYEKIIERKAASRSHRMLANELIRRSV
jgi:hypothetical protein